MDEILAADAANSPNRRENLPPSGKDRGSACERDVEIVNEREKWDAYYATLSTQEMPAPIRTFSEQLADRIGEILPQGGSILEAGCGAGWQSMVLAENEKYNVSLLDFSPKALEYAKQSFARHNLPAEFICQDVFQPGEPNYDLVFNAGVLEHYSFERQVAFLRGMAGRSRGYVLVLVPNRLCYWYWIWRMQASASGHWPFGKEVPATNLADAFEAAGMDFLGHWFGGENWTEQIIQSLSGLEEGVREHILAVHRSPLIPIRQKSHLMAALGSVNQVLQAPVCWSRSTESEDGNIDRLSAALSDSLAAINAAESRGEKDDLHNRRAAEHYEQCEFLSRQAEAHHQIFDKEIQQAESHRQQAEGHFQQAENHHRQAESHNSQAEQHSLQSERHHRRTARHIVRSKHRHKEIRDQLGQFNLQMEQFHDLQRELQDHFQREIREREQICQTRIQEKDRALAEITRQWNDGKSDLAHLRIELANLQSQLGAKQSMLQQWESVVHSRGWRFLQFLYRLRSAMLPRGSRREQMARLLYRAFHLRSVSKISTEGTAAGQVLRQTPPNFPNCIPLGLAVKNAEPARKTRSAAAAPRASIQVRGLVSVILPVYNHAHMLSQAIESVLAQTYKYFELIVVDDGSTDGIADALAKYATHPQVRILTQENQKLPHALSNGFLFARGEFWTWTSADNLMHPEQLRKQVEFLQSHAEIAMVYADYLAIDDAGELLSDPGFRPHNRRAPHDAAIHLPHSAEKLCTEKDNFIGPCFMYRGWVGRLLDEYDDNLGVEDYDYWMRMNSAFSIAHLGTEEPLYRYRVHDDSLSGRAAELRIHERAEKLMVLQRERAAFYDRPWVIHVDEPMWNRLERIATAPHRIVRWSGEPISPAVGEKTMFLVDARTLPKIAEPSQEFPWAVAAWFDGDVQAPHLFRGDIRRTSAACFAKDEQTLHRLALSTAKVFSAESADSMLALAIREANDRCFRDLSHSPKEHERKPPRVYFADDRRLRILLQVDSFTQGGMEQVVIDLAASLDPQRFQPALLVLGERGSAVSYARENGIRVLSLPENGMEEAYRNLLAEENIDLVNAHYSLFGANLAAKNGIPFVQTIHNTYVWLTPEQRASYQSNDKFTSAYACVSHSVAHYSDVKLGLPVEKMLVYPNGIDAARFAAPPSPPEREKFRSDLGLNPRDFVFLNVGTIQPTKSQIEMVRAFERVIAQHPHAKLMILGRSVDTKYRAELEKLIARLRLDRAVILAGHHDDIVSYYRAADAFILPSFWEGWSLAMIEAACAGLPIIATNVGGAPEMLAEVGGISIPPPFNSITDLDISTIWHYLNRNNPRFIGDMADAMLSYCAHRPRPAPTDAVRQKFDCMNSYRKYEQLFLWLIQGGHPSALRPWSLMANEPAASHASMTSAKRAA